MLRLFRHSAFLLILVTLVGSQSALAQAAVPVEWSIQTTGDLVIIDAKTSAGEPGQRYNRSPDYLEVAFPKAKMASGGTTQAIDKGLIQKVQTLQAGEATMVRVYVVSKPKASLSKTGSGYRYTVRLRDLAGAPTAATRPPVAAGRTANPTPTAQPIKPPVVQPVQSVQTPVTQPVQPAAAITAPLPDKRRAVVTAVFTDKPLVEALAELAQKAGYQAQIDPKVSGTVNLSLSEIPFEDALGLLLEPWSGSVSSEISTNTLIVRQVAKTEPLTNATPASDDPTVVYEYYPFAAKDAQKMMEAAQKAIPGLSYRVDPLLNILLVSGPREDVDRLGLLLKSMSQK